jgi:hypothetical protein
MKPIAVKKEDQKLFRELTKSEQAAARMHINEDEQIVSQHELVWKRIVRRYNLDKDKHYIYDSTAKEIFEYEQKKDPKEEVINLIWETIAKDLVKSRGVDLEPYGIDMVE